MATLALPAYLKWRNGRPRWEPGPGLRGKGWHGRDLKDDAGAWLPLERAMGEAARLNDEVAIWRRTGRRPLFAPEPARRTNTVEALYQKWTTSPRFLARAQKSQSDYKVKARPCLVRFGDMPVAALRHSDLYNWWELLYRERGHHMANGCIAAVRAMLSHGQRIGMLTVNPAKGLGIETAPPRQVLWLPAEVTTLVRTAEEMGLPSIADAIFLLLHTGQRPQDVVALPRRIFEDGRVRLTQAKTSAKVDAPMSDVLAARVRLMLSRRRVTSISGEEPMLLDEAGRPYTRDRLTKRFALARARAAETMPPIAEKEMRDMRDTAVTRLALAGCTLAQICAITGHTFETATSIMRHYLALQPEMADAAIGLLNTWMAEQGIAV